MAIKKITSILILLALFTLSPEGLLSAHAMPVQQAPQAPHSATIKVIDNVIGQQIQALVTNGETTDIEPQETFGTRAFGIVIAIAEVISAQSGTVLANFTALPQAGAWFIQQYADPVLSARWLSIGELLLVALSGAFAIGFVLQVLLTKARQHTTKRTTKTMTSRVAAALGWLGLSLIPVIVFVSAALILMNESDPPRLSRFVVMNVLYAITLHRLVCLLVKFLFAPRAVRLRLINVSDTTATYVHKWIARLGFVMIFGYFAVDVARLVRVPATAINAFSGFIGVLIVLIATIIIHQRRGAVATLLRGEIVASAPDLSSWQSLRLWLARTWHRVAITYLVIGYTVTMLSVGHGFTTMLQGTILTLIILILMRLAFHAIARVGANASSYFYRPVLRGLLRLAVWFAAILSIAASWGVDIAELIATPWGQRITGSILSIGTTILVATLIYETLNATIERHLRPTDSHGNPRDVSSRARTLLPMAQNTALVVLTGVVGLMSLSELGVNIAPLLAGAGVIGVAIGFGSQSLVKDFITGLFILIEDAIAIGDSVVIGDYSGTVESMTIRTLRLRGLNGDLHILPFGEVAKFTNQTKGFAFAVIDVGVAYSSDLHKVMSLLTEISEYLRTTDAHGSSILEPLEMFGVEKLADSAVVVRCRLKTSPGKQWAVRRAFLLEVKERFESEGIEIPFPTIMHIRRDENTSTTAISDQAS